MTKATLTPNGDGTFALSTGRLRLNQVAIPALGGVVTCQTLRATVTRYQEDADGSWSFQLGDLQPVIEAAPAAGPHPAYVEILRQHMQAAVEAGLCSLPEGMTIEEVVASVEWAPIGGLTFLGEGDVERVERGWIQDLRG